MRFCAAFLTLAVAAFAGLDFPQKPLPVKDAMAQIRAQSRALSSRNPALVRQASQIDTDLEWLQRLVTEDEPLEYRMQLTLDAYLLERALNDSDKAMQEVTKVEMDLSLKSRDCLNFGHGRKVRVEVQTMRGQEQESGWQICYLWVPTADVAPTEMHFPQPSSPTSAELPPGQYIIHAEKKDEHGNSVKSDSITLAVGGDEEIHWKLPVS
jgi:hypothetical protein